MLANWKVGGTSVFKVTKAGGIILAGGAASFDEGGNINGASNAAMRAGGRGFNVGVSTYATSFPDSGPVNKSTAKYSFCDSTASYAGDIDAALARVSAGLLKIVDASDALGGLQLGTASGSLRVGTHASIAAETVTGYITIKDSAGTDRKLAVVS